jgi:hypothetical protein
VIWNASPFASVTVVTKMLVLERYDWLVCGSADDASGLTMENGRHQGPTTAQTPAGCRAWEGTSIRRFQLH